MEQKKNQNININVELKKTVRSALKNADTIDNAILEVGVVNPKELHLDDEIFGFTVKPVSDSELGKNIPNVIRYVAIRPIRVSSLSNTISDGKNVTINGNLDVPNDAGRIIKLKDALVKSEAEARAIASTATEIELEKVHEILKEAEKAKEFLKEQIENDRF